METIFQSIEILSKEKGIDPQIVLDAVKDAMLIAARKHFRTTEDYVAELHEKTGALQLFAVKKVVEAVEDPAKEMTLGEARRINPAITVKWVKEHAPNFSAVLDGLRKAGLPEE